MDAVRNGLNISLIYLHGQLEFRLIIDIVLLIGMHPMIRVNYMLIILGIMYLLMAMAMVAVITELGLTSQCKVELLLVREFILRTEVTVRDN